MIKRKSTLFEQGLDCVVMLAVGVSNTMVLPHPVRHKIFPLVILVLFLVIFADHGYKTRHSKEDIQRAQRDERNQMLLEKTVWYCRQAEDWLLLGLFVALSVGFGRYDLAYALFWVLVGRSLLAFCIRWWLDRRY